MVRSSTCRVIVLLGILAVFGHSETVADPPRDYQDIVSGELPADVSPVGTTTREPLHHMTEPAFTFDYEDATQGLAVDENEGVLGPGAITAIVIAVFLGASVLLALIVITLRKFTAS
ncbi:protein SNORC [Syngnathus scovelli]|uniref:protein SNORC n=1 Tax=Syngnathus scovelli TaxID=161590 RepID=UPI00210F7D98|nr:protein SNORC [Syngnathus scovelli]XP_049602493.1 protein SNORC [Syngnathus scovelli]